MFCCYCTVLYALCSFLGAVDKIGTAYVDRHIATGRGAYLALPLMRAKVEQDPHMTQKEAHELLFRCLKVLYYRDAQSYPKVRAHLISL
jgi:20S proteasome subunit beta 7